MLSSYLYCLENINFTKLASCMTWSQVLVSLKGRSDCLRHITLFCWVGFFSPLPLILITVRPSVCTNSPTNVTVVVVSGVWKRVRLCVCRLRRSEQSSVSHSPPDWQEIPIFFFPHVSSAGCTLHLTAAFCQDTCYGICFIRDVLVSIVGEPP
jgi:hypothetical protein